MRGYLGFALVALLIVGCGAEEPAQDKGSAPWHDGVRPATVTAKLGGADTSCPLPVAVDLPDKWKPARLDVGDFNQGGFDVLCEIDAKPAGAAGFIRVWVGPSTQPRMALESYVAHEVWVSWWFNPGRVDL